MKKKTKIMRTIQFISIDNGNLVVTLYLQRYFGGKRT